MKIVRNQKNEYLKEYFNSVKDTLVTHMEEDAMTARIHAQKALYDREKALEDALKNGVDVGGIVKYIVYPIDVVHVSESDKLASDFYYLVKEDGKEKLYPIRF